jgi:hypothetical protein
VKLAKQLSVQQPHTPLASTAVDDVCSRSWENEQADVYLLFGPLFHLTDRKDRLQALTKVYRVLKREAVALAVGVSHFASTLDGLRSGFLIDPEF